MAQTPESKAATPPSTKSSPPRPPPIATNPKVDEGTDSYRVGGLHPVYVGDVYNDRYRVLNKIGYGSYSTVWLVRDLTAEYVCPSSISLECSSLKSTKMA